MKLRIILALLITPVLALSQGYTIDVTVEGSKDTVAYLGYHFGNQKYIQDTAAIINNKVVFEGETALVRGVYFYYSINSFFEFIVDDQEFSISTKPPNFIKDTKVTGSRINQDFMNLQRYNLEKQELAKELQDSIAKVEDPETRSALEGKLTKVNADAAAYQDSLRMAHTDDYLGKFLTALRKPQVPDSIGNDSSDREFVRFSYYKDHFFDNFDLGDEELLRSPMYHSVITEYLDKLTIQHPDSLIKASDNILTEAQKSEVSLRYCLVTMSNKFETSNIMGFDKVFVHLVDQYYLSGKAQWANKELLARLNDRVNQIKPGLIGNQAPSLSLVDMDMNPLDLDLISARFIVLYFYDHDCSHCKKKTPILQSLYPDLKAKDVEVIAVNINTDIEKWKDYIISNNLTFLNGADPYVQSNFRYEYDIRTTPTVYILDENKTIVGKKIEVDNIPQFIEYISANN